MSKNNRERRRAASEGLSIKVPAASSPKPGSTSIDNIPPQPTQDIVVRGSRKPTQRTEVSEQSSSIVISPRLKAIASSCTKWRRKKATSRLL